MMDNHDDTNKEIATAELPSTEIQTSDQQLFCEPCLTRNVDTTATNFCRDCDEQFCDNCTLSHKAQKATREHDVVDIKSCLDSKKQCEPCRVKHKQVAAAFACVNCDEFLCEDCKTFHNSQKQNKSHIVKSILEELKCEPCRSADRIEGATSYCEDCKEPEPLCRSCAEQHVTMKKTLNHRMSHDIATYILRFRHNETLTQNMNAVVIVPSTPSNGQPTCEPCRFRQMTIVATYYCKDCEEMYCKPCMMKHKSKKISSNHDVIAVRDIFKTLEMCEPCKYSNVEVVATHICDECEEHLCGECIKTHLAQKKNRNHNIKPVSASFLCDNCSTPGNEKKAIYFCQKCEYLICDECAEEHKALKMTRDHTLSRDMASCVLLKQKNVQTQNKADKESLFTDGARPKMSVIPFKDAQAVTDNMPRSNCDPCSVQNKTIEASFFCVECEEYLCKLCFEYHQAQIENKDHQIDNIEKKAILCTTCLSRGKEIEACTICQDCIDPNPCCQSCAQMHLSMKKTKGHKLTTNFKPFVNATDRKELNPNKINNTDNNSKMNVVLPEENKHSDNDHSLEELGKPYSTEGKSDYIVLQWKAIKPLPDKTYQIMYKEIPNGKWRPYVTTEPCVRPKLRIAGLKSATSYMFKVRIVDDMTGQEGPFSAESTPITTKESPAIGLVKKAELIEKGPPGVYRLPIKENITARNDSAKTRKFYLGKAGNDPTERTLMLVGSTGSGKTTLINSFANYLMGVTWEDNFRFTLINLEGCEIEKEHDQALSQTEWVTCYTLHNNVSDRVNYSVNLIDTPGFGDTRGLEQDKKIVEQIRQLFTSTGEQGVATLDAVCFILKAPDARLTTPQRYIFESILSLFGNDIKDNICTLITFADGQRPPVLAGIQALDGLPLPHEKYFTFNNSALYSENSENTSDNLASFFWDMGIKSCERFFDHIKTMQTRSLVLTSEVLRKRAKLENTVLNLQQLIDMGLSKIGVLETEVEIFTKHAKAIVANKNFEYEVEEDRLEKIDLTGKSQYTTNCLICNFTCHESCTVANDNDKAKCCAMNKEGNCTQCPKGCPWKEHHNTPYIIKWSKHKVKKRYDEMKKKYEEATRKTLTQEQVLDEMNQDIIVQEQAIHVMMEVITRLNNRLKEIALRPDPLSTVQYIDLLIATEEREKKSGFEARIDALHKCKKSAQYGQSVQIFQDRVRNTRKSMAASEVADEILKDDKTIIGGIKRFFKSVF